MTDIHSDSIGPGGEEITRLKREISRLQRKLTYTEDVLKRNKATAKAKANLGAAIEAEKIKQEQYMSLLLENCPDIIILFDQDGHFTYCTDAFLRRARIPSFGLIGGQHYLKVFGRFADAQWLERVDAALARSIKRKETITLEEVIDIGGNGILRSYTIQFTPMLSEAGKVEGAMVLFHDLTDLIQAKKQAERAREQAERASTAKSDFLASMSHEMRTPMNAIIGMTQIALQSEGAERKDYCLDRIDEASTHLLGVINDILDMSKIEAGKLELSSGEFELEKMLMKVSGVLSFRIDEKRQSFQIHLDPNMPHSVIADEQRLAQVITNLLSNAVKFTPEGGRITLSARKAGEADGICTLEFSVADTGIGISEEQQNRLFRSFEQADTGISRRFGGTGLGLAISKSIVEMMGGHIWVKSREQEGSTFSFQVRARCGQHTAPDPINGASQHINGSAATADHFERCRILLAEDIEINREIVMALVAPTGVAVDSAENGRVACEKLFKDPTGYDMIFMDIHMPEMDGYEATRIIRASGIPGAANIPIVAMTANVFREDVEKCLDAGMNGHVGKPLSAEEVLAAMRTHLPAGQLAT